MLWASKHGQQVCLCAWHKSAGIIAGKFLITHRPTICQMHKCLSPEAPRSSINWDSREKEQEGTGGGGGAEERNPYA